MKLNDILITVQSCIFMLTAFLALIYACLILFNRRMHRTNHIFILNICINIITCCTYYTVYFQIRSRRMSLVVCVIFDYCFAIASMQIPFAFVTFTIHRYCSILYFTTGFFKTKKWVILCITLQWISQFVCSLARLQNYTVRKTLFIFFFFLFN